MSNSAPSYPASVAQPFREELTAVKFKELLTPAEVDAALNRQDDKIILVVLNSVCGCAARSARPGTVLSLLNTLVPDEYVTLFAGMEKEAVEHFRTKYLQGLTPSSPNIALFKNAQLLYILQRYQVEGKSAGDIAKELTGIFDKVCSKRNSSEDINELKNHITTRYRVTIDSEKP
jgi:putative YphP/YqiW family bacilliredoxin